jgi:S-adenosylmethionine decarboxylase
MTEVHNFYGIHVFGEMYGIGFADLNDVKKLEDILSKGIEKSGASLCSIQSKSFSPCGVTILGLLSESHASIHTYPDFGSLFFDTFTCGNSCDPQKVADELIAVLQPKKHNLQVIIRGQKDEKL